MLWKPQGVLDEVIVNEIVAFIDVAEEIASKPFNRFAGKNPSSQQMSLITVIQSTPTLLISDGSFHRDGFALEKAGAGYALLNYTQLNVPNAKPVRTRVGNRTGSARIEES